MISIKYDYIDSLNDLLHLKIKPLDDSVSILQICFLSHIHHLPFYSKLLNKNEKKRASSFQFAEDRTAFIISRASLRILLSKLTGLEAENINFFYNSYGKPYIEKK